MTTLENRPNTALLVVDVQNGVVAEAHDRDVVVANVASLVARPGRSRSPWSGCSTSTRALPGGSEELAASSPNWPRTRAESLVAEELRRLLRGHRPGDRAGRAWGSGALIVAGAETDACIRSTLHGAFARGYDATLVSDAHTTGDRTEWGAPPPTR